MQCPYITSKTGGQGAGVVTFYKRTGERLERAGKPEFRARTKERKEGRDGIVALSGVWTKNTLADRHRRSCSLTNWTTDLTSMESTWLSSSEGGEIGGRDALSYFLESHHCQFSKHIKTLNERRRKKTTYFVFRHAK